MLSENNRIKLEFIIKHIYGGKNPTSMWNLFLNNPWIKKETIRENKEMKLDIQFIKLSKMKSRGNWHTPFLHQIFSRKNWDRARQLPRDGGVGVHNGDLLPPSKIAPCFPDPSLIQSKASAPGDGLETVPPPSPRQHVAASGGGLETCSHPRIPANKRPHKAETGCHRGAGGRTDCCGSTTAETRARDWGGTGQRRNPKPLPWTTNALYHRGRAKGRERLDSARPAKDRTSTLKNLKTPCFPGPALLSCLSHVQLFMTLWTVAHQTPQSLGFSRQEYWRELPFLSPGHYPDPGIKPICLLRLLQWQAGSLPLVPPGKPRPHSEHR